MTIRPFYFSARAKFTQRIPLYRGNDTPVQPQPERSEHHRQWL